MQNRMHLFLLVRPKSCKVCHICGCDMLRRINVTFGEGAEFALPTRKMVTFGLWSSLDLPVETKIFLVLLVFHRGITTSYRYTIIYTFIYSSNFVYIVYKFLQ